ncbi:Bidirectional sugar transporter SWEET17 [Glycine max]|nr:Bidirectional sugar transporter SWEET17 [Glycine max]
MEEHDLSLSSNTCSISGSTPLETSTLILSFGSASTSCRPMFWKIKKHGSTEDFSSLPYICTLLNCSLWTYYGIIKAREYLVATVDGFGIVVETIYVILFLIYAPKGIRGRTLILAVILDVAISAVAVVTTQLALQREAHGGVVGVMGAGLNIVMYFSPLSAMRMADGIHKDLCCFASRETIRLSLLFSIYPTLIDFALRLGFDVNLIAIALQAIFGVSLRIIVHIWVMSKKGPLYVAMFKAIGIIFAVIMGIGFLGGSIYLGSVLGAAIAVIGFYAVIWGKSQEQAKEECEVYDDSESYSPLSLFWRTREWRNKIIAII